MFENVAGRCLWNLTSAGVSRELEEATQDYLQTCISSQCQRILGGGYLAVTATFLLADKGWQVVADATHQLSEYITSTGGEER